MTLPSPPPGFGAWIEFQATETSTPPIYVNPEDRVAILSRHDVENAVQSYCGELYGDHTAEGWVWNDSVLEESIAYFALPKGHPIYLAHGIKALTVGVEAKPTNPSELEGNPLFGAWG